ncbi:hypothetical protein [Curtobacterium sp. MCBD17_032]|uniref:hypothetical protein n=1 Tax=Curtobacterium sp. MCBD17_032 TaxID=2175659 RepID=UPI000DA971F2|nr:hypothetical protein [Curtobacterium sp. MCBD17_032]PZE86268.1 hypothetical protein DEI91_03965 [Curtobacterium sp. MCBD17_032]
MQKKTAATLTTLALIAAIAATGVAAATVAGPEATGTTDGTVRTGGVSTVVQTTAPTTDDDGWQGQLPDADRFRTLSDAEQRAVFTRVDRLIGDLRGTGDGAGLVAQLSGYRGEIERARG